MTADQGQQPQQRDWAEAARVLHQYVAASNQALGAGAIGGHSELVHAAHAGAEACEQVAEHQKANKVYLAGMATLQAERDGAVEQMRRFNRLVTNGAALADRLRSEQAGLALFAADLLDLLGGWAIGEDDTCFECERVTHAADCAVGTALAASADPLAAGQALREELERLRVFAVEVDRALSRGGNAAGVLVDVVAAVAGLAVDIRTIQQAQGITRRRVVVDVPLPEPQSHGPHGDADPGRAATARTAGEGGAGR